MANLQDEFENVPLYDEAMGFEFQLDDFISRHMADLSTSQINTSEVAPIRIDVPPPAEADKSLSLSISQLHVPEVPAVPAASEPAQNIVTPQKVDFRPSEELSSGQMLAELFQRDEPLITTEEEQYSTSSPFVDMPLQFDKFDTYLNKEINVDVRNQSPVVPVYPAADQQESIVDAQQELEQPIVLTPQKEPEIEDLMHYKQATPLKPATPPAEELAYDPELLPRVEPVKIVALSDIEPPKPKPTNPRDYSLPLDPPSFFTAFGFGGSFVTLQNNDHNYSHNINVGNLAPSLKEVKYLRYLHYFPGPIERTKNKTAVNKFIVERGKYTLLWEILSHLYPLENGKILDKTLSSPQSEEVRLARDWIIEILKFLPSPEHGENIYQRYPGWVEPAVFQDVTEQTKDGHLAEALSTAITGGAWSEAFLNAGLLGDKASFVKVVREYARSTYRPGSSMHTLWLLKAMQVTEIFMSGSEFELISRWADNLIIVLSNIDQLETFSAAKFVQTLGKLLYTKQEYEAAALCNLLAQEAPEEWLPIWAGSTIDSLQMTEVFQSLTKSQEWYFLPYMLIYANMLAEVGLIEKAKEYLDVILAKRDFYGPLKSNLYFISHVRYLNERISKMSTWKVKKVPEEGVFSQVKNFFGKIPVGLASNTFYQHLHRPDSEQTGFEGPYLDEPERVSEHPAASEFHQSYNPNQSYNPEIEDYRSPPESVHPQSTPRFEESEEGYEQRTNFLSPQSDFYSGPPTAPVIYSEQGTEPRTDPFAYSEQETGPRMDAFELHPAQETEPQQESSAGPPANPFAYTVQQSTAPLRESRIKNRYVSYEYSH